MDLFASATAWQPIPLPDGDLALLSQLPLPIDNATVLARLVEETAWRADTITLWGKQFLQPRLTCWQGEADYRYSGLTMKAQAWSPLVATLRDAVETASGYRFNSVLLNYYRNERDSMGMHSDDEVELGPAPTIASLSFGASRNFILRHKQSRQTVKLALPSGSLLIMRGPTQSHWLHGINKSTRVLGPRVNLTFRYIR
ncbi:alpha-ketoglutarate-dependent dioxygenase AlkB [Massilia sp. PAMC28688]|uniref:alpha-ketoglutarate-dependent dioxygenase AlkB family protein n=1 Tax=Massilia sp. PAMC28688 TaxID=2861283 RepID=UPI001C62D7A1|nr:alpha-ketoglutarate-dependent dioxygenase AlkB [Massilia sp. PAMC28688]QYF95123.1 alpha-ketoglutarate-dependent dioxygenase AlkB [Massilia sp. PAMC28688]